MDSLAFIIFLTTLAVTTSGAIATPVLSTLSCQNDVCKDGVKQFICAQRRLLCCRGETNNSFQVFTQKMGFKCCTGAGQMYNFQRDICVGGRIRPRGQDEDNCGPDKVFNTSNEVCCEGNVFSKVAEGVCCGDEYLTDGTGCCDMNRPIKYNTSEQVCCRRIDNDPALGAYQLFDIPHGKCCLQNPYNSQIQKCVEDEYGCHVIDIASHDMEIPDIPTCSGDIYDPTTHGCCRGESTTVYELSRKLCEMGRLYVKTDPLQDALCIVNYVDEEGRQRQKAIPYRKNPNMRCISSHGVTTLASSEDICGDKTYNLSTDLCCSGKLHRNMKLAGFQCCLAGVKAFNPEREICCLNEVNRKMAYNDGARCCFKEPYSPRTHECSAGRITEKACPTYGNKCHVSVPILKRMKKHYVYFGIAGGMTVDRPSRRRVARQWKLSDLKTFKFKKGKVTVVKAKSKGPHFLKSTECGCPDNLVAGTRYMFVSSQPVRRKTLSLESANNGFVIPIVDKQQIGLVFETIIEKSK